MTGWILPAVLLESNWARGHWVNEVYSVSPAPLDKL
jgi:hypothetical protein